MEATATSSLAKDGQIEFVATPEGRLVNTGGGNYQQEYFVTDHLGNIRVAFRVNTNGTLNLTQVQNYYSFGKDMGDATMNYTASPQNQYKYSSKELQQELSLMNYDFGARHYDPRIGRWTGVDLLAETYENVSPYNYVANSPISNIDPNGMDFSQGIPCPKWGEPGGGLFSAGANVLASFAAGLLGSVGNGPVALNKANAPGQQASLQSRSNITSSLNEDGTTVQEGGGDPGGKKKANAKARKGGGEKDGWLGKAAGIAITTVSADGPLPIGDAIGAVVVAGAAVHDLSQIKYVTYTLRNAKGQVYVGRSSGYGDPYSIMNNRFSGHHMKAFGYGNPQLDRVAQGYPVGYYAIRGREQSVIDAYGGIGSPALGNTRNGIWEYNPNRPLYMGASNLMFGPYVK